MKWALFFLLGCTCLQAKDFEKKGQTFPIIEENFVQWIQNKVEKFDFEAYAKKMAESYYNPKPLSHLTPACSKRSFSIDAPKDLGEVNLLFFDSDNEKHLDWARKQGDQFLWVLVKGKPTLLEKQEGREVFFDQFGILSSNLKIEHTPARVTSEGNKLIVEEEPQ